MAAPFPDASAPPFLNVAASLSGQTWLPRLDQAGQNRALAMAQIHGMPELIARVLAGRGVTVDEARDFLSPTLAGLMPDPSSLADCDRAAERIADAAARHQRVAVFGDYDVDGAASSALMARFLMHFGIEAEIYIPDRIFEGYGPNPAAINALIDNGAELIVTVDCGSTSDEALAEAVRRGVDVVVIDHHQLGVELPPCHALVNPNRHDDISGQGHLCAAGVVFLVLVAVRRVLRERRYPRIDALDLVSLLDLVALATICDVVPLKGLNRAYVVKGLTVIRALGNTGLAALIRCVGVGGPVMPYHLGFLLGPRINAGGRIGDAALGSRLLVLDDAEKADVIAGELDRLNRERQAIEAAMLAEAEAEALADDQGDPKPAVILTAREGWHPGVVGLLAARLKEKLRRPAFAIAFDASGRGSGSGRSIPGFDLGAMVRAAVDNGLLLKGGGHSMAAGLTVERSKIGALRLFFEEQAGRQVAALTAERVLKIDGAVSASGATPEFIDALERGGPYGPSHSQPTFALPAHRIADARVVGENHLKVTLKGPQGDRLEGIAFRAVDTPLARAILDGRGDTFHIAGTLALNHWQGARRPQIRIADAAPAT